MSATVSSRIQFKRDTTANWDAARGFIPLEGEVIVYNDYKTIIKEIDGEERIVQIPGMKVGDGRAYVQDLPFIDEELRDKIMSHISNTDVRVSLAEKSFWNNKINVDDAYENIYNELENETLILNRN